jgi:hypothetical protein
MSILDRPDAVAAFGIISNLEGLDASSLPSDPLWSERIRHAMSRGEVTVSIDMDELVNAEFSSNQIDELAEAWTRGVSDFEKAQSNRGLRLQIYPADPGTDHLVVAALREAHYVDSIIFIDKGLSGPDRWGWPLKVRSMGSDVGDALESYDHPRLIRYDKYVTQGEESDLLVVESLEYLVSAPRQGLSAGFLLVLAESNDAIQVKNVRRLNEIVGFRAAAIVAKNGDLQSQIHRFIDELSHNNPPDIAITHAIERGTPHVIVGDPTFLNQARVTVATANLADRLERDFRDGYIDSAEFGAMISGIDALPSAKARDSWTSEGEAATETAECAGSMVEELEAQGGSAETRIEPKKRFLQAQVFEVQGGVSSPRTKSFEADAPHQIKVRIGPSSLNWIIAPHAFPDNELPPSEARLTVTMIAPALMKESTSQEILIGATGTSTVATFDVSVPSDVAEIDATVIVYCEGKHLQTGVLSGPVTKGEESPEATGIEFARGTPSRSDLDHQQAFDLMIWKKGAEFEMALFDPSVKQGEPSNRPLRPTLAGVKQVVDGIRNELFEAASKIEQLESGIEKAGLKTIRALAEQGEFLRRKLFDPSMLSRIRRIQIVSQESSDFFPVEFLYDYVLPDEDAQLCPEFKKSKSPHCSASCYAAEGNSKFVCPSGFWALNRIIERQVRPNDRADSVQPESSGRKPSLDFPDAIIFSASNEVNAANSNEIAETIEEMGTVAQVYPANTWQEWIDLVGRHYPSLLVTLPHNVQSSPFNKLQISATEDLALNRIRSDHVVPATVDVGPVMLLLGCNTANSEVGYQDFVNEMRSSGAAIVVATLTYVLGPQAARLAREFVRQIGSAGGQLTIGEIMRLVRARMLAEDNIMALAITAFGDADWRFGEEES